MSSLSPDLNRGLTFASSHILGNDPEIMLLFMIYTRLGAVMFADMLRIFGPMLSKPVALLTLRLHYVPGDHGSHGSPKRSAPCDLVNFCLGTQVLLSIITFRHGLSRYPLQTVG